MPHKLADDKESAGAVANRISISWAACYLYRWSLISGLYYSESYWLSQSACTESLTIYYLPFIQTQQRKVSELEESN